MQIPVDVSQLNFIAAGPPEAVLDYNSKQQRADADGQPLYTVRLVWLDPDGASVVKVRVAGSPKGVDQGVTVKLTGLVAYTWEMADDKDPARMRKGMSYRAERIETLGSFARATGSSAAS